MAKGENYFITVINSETDEITRITLHAALVSQCNQEMEGKQKERGRASTATLGLDALEAIPPIQWINSNLPVYMTGQSRNCITNQTNCYR